MSKRQHRTGLAALLIVAAAACSKSGTMTVRLVDGPGDFESIKLNVAKIELRGDGGWTTVSSPGQVVDLISLQNGVHAELATSVTLPAGDYTQIRFVLGDGNTVTPTGGTPQALTVPSGAQTGVKFLCNVHVGGGEAHDLYVDMDGARSIFVHDTGSSKYILRPVVRCIDAVVSTTVEVPTPPPPPPTTPPPPPDTLGSISGQFAAMDTEAMFPLAGIAVTAQTIDTAGNPTVVRTVTTAADGTYTLDLLPVGGTYYVVTQPVYGTAVYAATVSDPLTLTTGATTAFFSYGYGGVADSGGVVGAITPTATLADADEVVALQPLVAGGVTQTFVVRSTNAAVASGSETYAMPGLPVGTYSLQPTRRTLVNGIDTFTTGAAVNAVVAIGATGTVDLSIP